MFRRQNCIFGSCDYISFPKIMGSSAYFEVYTVVMFKYDDFQKASRISLRGPSISINSIDASITEGSKILKSVDSNEISILSRLVHTTNMSAV